MKIKQRPDNWPKQTEELWKHQLEIRDDAKEQILGALSTWKKKIKQRPNNWPKETVVLEPEKEERWKKKIKQRPNNWPKETQQKKLD